MTLSSLTVCNLLSPSSPNTYLRGIYNLFQGRSISYLNLECPGGSPNPWTVFKCLVSSRPFENLSPSHTWQQYCFVLSPECSVFICNLKIFSDFETNSQRGTEQEYEGSLCVVKCSERESFVLQDFWQIPQTKGLLLECLYIMCRNREEGLIQVMAQ